MYTVLIRLHPFIFSGYKVETAKAAGRQTHINSAFARAHRRDMNFEANFAIKNAKGC